MTLFVGCRNRQYFNKRTLPFFWTSFAQAVCIRYYIPVVDKFWHFIVARPYFCLTSDVQPDTKAKNPHIAHASWNRSSIVKIQISRGIPLAMWCCHPQHHILVDSIVFETLQTDYHVRHVTLCHSIIVTIVCFVFSYRCYIYPSVTVLLITGSQRVDLPRSLVTRAPGLSTRLIRLRVGGQMTKRTCISWWANTSPPVPVRGLAKLKKVFFKSNNKTG